MYSYRGNISQTLVSAEVARMEYTKAMNFFNSTVSPDISSVLNDISLVMSYDNSGSSDLMSLAVNNTNSAVQVVSTAAINIRNWIGRYSIKDFEFSRISTCGVQSIASDDIVDEVIADVEDLLDRCGPSVTLSPVEGLLSDVKLSAKTGCIIDGPTVQDVPANFTNQVGIIASSSYDEDGEIADNNDLGIGVNRSITLFKWVGTNLTDGSLELGLYSPSGLVGSFGTITARARLAARARNSINSIVPGGDLNISVKPYDGNPTYLTNRSVDVTLPMEWNEWVTFAYTYYQDPRAHVLLSFAGIPAAEAAYYFEIELICSETFENPNRVIASFVDVNRNVRSIVRTTMYSLFAQVYTFDSAVIDSLHARFGKQMYNWRSYIASLYRSGVGASITAALNTVTGLTLGDDQARDYLSGYILTWTTFVGPQCDYRQFYDNVASLLRANLSQLTTNKSARKALLEARSTQA
jgi:hypothetical protein